MRRFVLGLGAPSAVVVAAFMLAACGRAEDATAPTVDTTRPPKPALWKIADADTTIYVFGTIHLLPRGMEWQTPAFTGALKEARAVYLEADSNLAPAQINALVQRIGMLPPSERLSEKLDDAQREALRAAAVRFDIPQIALEQMRPWYASVMISDAAIRRAGFEQDSGIESLLRPAARDAGKEMRYLETVEAQLSAYTTLPEAVQVKVLAASLADLDNAAGAVTEMVTAWRSGDDAALSRLVIDEQLASQPEIYESLMVRRNQNWAPQLDAVMRTESGVFLVAVGAGHLLGPDSVLAQMERLGHPASRVQ
ncbi:MAG: hypothetical protein B7Y90_13750 [Alphaproteobacteria bacterium 32-64-14]|nr:MAG: hypothetical protein B7Y90_13750 [Alphaproteobacteria bacterium 32-64-14]